MRYTILIEKGRESGYVAHCPTLRGCVSQGKSKVEAVKCLRAAMQDYIECLVEDGIPVPREVGKEILNVEVCVH